MNIRREAKIQSPFPQTFIDRCIQLGLVGWRLDLNGMPIEDPIAPGILGMWLSSRPFRMMMAESAMIWATNEDFNALEVSPGVWVFPFPEEHRNRRTGYFALIGFSPEVLTSDLVE